MATFAELTDQQLTIKVEKQNRRLQRNSSYRSLYKLLQERSATRYISTPGTLKASAKKLAMKFSQTERKAA